MEPLTEQKRAVLLDFLEAFLPFNERKELAFEEGLLKESEEKAIELQRARFEAGVQKGIEMGMNFVYSALLDLARVRLGMWQLEDEIRLRKIKDFQLIEELAERILDASSWGEWLQGNKPNHSRVTSNGL